MAAHSALLQGGLLLSDGAIMVVQAHCIAALPC